MLAERLFLLHNAIIAHIILSCNHFHQFTKIYYVYVILLSLSIVQV
nr:MAG TPA: hypothetical protein [Caudoviricetes sp.]